MNDLISKHTLLEAAKHNIEFQEGIVDVYILESILAGMPAVDAAPVVHGRWISYLDGEHLMPERYYKCSVCSDRGYKFRRNYCPNCGAKMDGGNDNY